MDETREVRLQIMLLPQELKAIDDWRFANRMPSRASAVRELLQRGLAAEGFKFGRARTVSILFWRGQFPHRKTEV